ncbi:pathogenesis-related protein [Acrasis kona]|uniref:Pathogenesis-related protein n=1 Tax=Acrasis kona TaxID=1008807 RepID=A0AAW2Z4R5_9EUKA
MYQYIILLCIALCAHCQVFSGHEIDDIVYAHNQIRSSVGINETVSWSNELALFASAYASNCQGSNLVSHNPNRVIDGIYLGENIFGTTDINTISAMQAVDYWASEKAYYNYASNRCALGKICGHYTQMVWKSSTLIGCARIKCSNLRYGNTILCNYAPGGNVNVDSQRPY